MANPDPGSELRALAARYQLEDHAAERLSVLLGMLVDDPHAPTAIRERRRAVDDHLADSLVALEVPEVRVARRIIDLGSGAGLPGIPLAIAQPDAHVTLLESSARKCGFIERAVAACGIENADVVHARAESWPGGVGRFELVTARALAALDVVAEYAAPLLVEGGTLVAWRGRRDRAEEAAAARAAAILGMEPGVVIGVMPYAGAHDRHLHLMSKVGATPERFPRRPGMARKRPLSGFSRS